MTKKIYFLILLSLVFVFSFGMIPQANACYGYCWGGYWNNTNYYTPQGNFGGYTVTAPVPTPHYDYYVPQGNMGGYTITAPVPTYNYYNPWNGWNYGGGYSHWGGYMWGY